MVFEKKITMIKFIHMCAKKRFFASEAPEALQKVKEHFLWFGHVLLPTSVRVCMPVCESGHGEIVDSTFAHFAHEFARRNRKKSKVKGRKALRMRKKRKKKRKRRQNKR